MSPRRSRPEVTVAHPRMSLWYVLGRVRMRLLEIQVWDVAGTMTFYLLLSVLPATVALLSVVGLLGIQDQTVDTVSDLIQEIFPTLDPAPYARTLITLARTGGGVPGILLGTLGALISASNGLAAFHRALHRVYDTREGRPFLRFRAIVLGETAIVVALLVLATFVVGVGGEWSQRLGAMAGVSRETFAVWNLVKWPLLLVMLTLCVSLAYHLFPNVRLPRYRLMTSGSVLSVLVLFGSALAVGRLASLTARISEVLPALNGAIALLLLVWLANIVVIGGAALDAEFLRARQIALGLPAWDRILLEPQARHSLDFLERDAEETSELSRSVVEAIREDEPLRGPRTWLVVDASSALAVEPSARSARKILASARADGAAGLDGPASTTGSGDPAETARSACRDTPGSPASRPGDHT